MDMKTSRRIPPGTPKYHRLTSENRIIIWILKKGGKSETYIAARIGCPVSTISRELDRNKGKANRRAAAKAAKRRGGTRPPGQAWPSAHIRRDLRLKPALQAELKTAILPPNHKKVLA